MMYMVPILLLLLDSVILIGGLANGNNLCSSGQFWSIEFRSCLKCKPCLVTLVPCGQHTDAVCGHLENKSRRKSSPTQLVRESMMNTSQKKEEFLEQLRKENIRQQSNSDNKDIEIDGEVKYSDESGGRRRNDLHSDLQAIEREILASFEGTATTMEPTTTGSATAHTTSPEMIVGKKILYPTIPMGGFDPETSVASSAEIGPDVFGAVRQKPKNGEAGFSDNENKADEFGLLHSLLYHSTSDEE